MCSLPACRDYWYPTLCERAELWGWRRWSDVCGAVWEWGLISFPPPRLLVRLLPNAAGGHSLVEQSSCLIRVCAARVARQVVRHWNLDVVPGRWLLVALLGQHGLLGPSLPQPFSATVKYSFCINVSDPAVQSVPCLYTRLVGQLQQKKPLPQEYIVGDHVCLCWAPKIPAASFRKHCFMFFNSIASAELCCSLANVQLACWIVCWGGCAVFSTQPR